MQISKYREAKAAGGVELKRYGNSLQIIKQQFHPDTGTEILPQISTFERAQILQQRDDAVELVADLNALLADIDKL